MPSEYNEFVKNIESNFNADSNESVFDSLFREYERVVFKSIITTFGFDLFIKDQYGGDVDTMHNVRNIGDDPKLTYKNADNAVEYDNRGEYSHKQVEGSGTNFQKIKHEARLRYGEDNLNNTVQDAYEDKPLDFLGKSRGHPTDKSAELDHVIPVKSIHDDRGRVLAGLSTEELADAEDNLRWTNEHLNKSMRADEIPDYIAAHPELPEDVKERMMDAYNQSKACYEKKISQAYYFDFSNPNCRQFYKDAALSAGKRGVQMGLRQIMGFLMTELWVDIKDEIKACDGTFNGAFNAVGCGLKKWYETSKEDYKEIFAQFGEGALSGVLSSLMTTLCNVFFTTSENVSRILKQAWASVVEAVSILLFNSKEKYLCDRMTSAAKVLATGASMIIGTSVQETIHVKLSEVAIPKELKTIISTFAGSLCTGLLTVSLLFYIDNDPFGEFLETVYGVKVENLKEQGMLFKQYCAEIEKIDLSQFEFETAYAYKLSVKLQNANDNAQMNLILKRALVDLKLPSLWEGSSLEEKMNDANWVLTI